MKKAILIIGLLVLAIALSGCTSLSNENIPALTYTTDTPKIKNTVANQCVISTTEDECNLSYVQIDFATANPDEFEEAFFMCIWEDEQCVSQSCIGISTKGICNKTATRFGWCKWYDYGNICGVWEKTATQQWR